MKLRLNFYLGHNKTRQSRKPRYTIVPCPEAYKGDRDSVTLFLCHQTKFMAFTLFLGRVLFASVFLLSAYQEFNEFGVDGGPLGRALKPKFDVFTSHVNSCMGIQVPEFEIKHLVAAGIVLKGIGGILFIFGSSFGAILLVLHQIIVTPIKFDFYNYDIEAKEFNQLFIKFTQNMALFGALLFFIGMRNSMPRRPHKKKVSKTKTY